jgi:hypothetical protein
VLAVLAISSITSCIVLLRSISALPNATLLLAAYASLRRPTFSMFSLSKLQSGNISLRCNLVSIATSMLMTFASYT